MTNKRSIVVTGASSGIGRATALHLARNGWRVFASVRKTTDAESLHSEAAGLAIEPITMDLGDRSSIASAASDVAAKVGSAGLDALFNNAGIGIPGPVELLPPDDLRRAFEINLFGTVAVTQAFLPLIRQAKGRIVNVGSVGDHLTPPFGAAIAGPKAALASVTFALRLELRAQGIHVVLIEPGSINTPTVGKTLGGVDTLVAGYTPEQATLYGSPLRAMAAAFTKNEQAGSPPEAVASVVERALNDRRPRTRYPAGKDARLLTLLARFLPEKLLDRAILRTFGQPADFDARSS